ncbi:helix-hairpin-helix domain-containing protein [Ornithinibacillus halotolerans]|uniref:Competence protein ComE n=1 Tax=Ornithinibacillus halotolerans TaxID=1274357 RepID=A0A916W570_9BACI|nr:helix-hairpin-helix domain-containing protein [Ornithinibacillus halotolerans]GGA68870.1 competence protein ComE [Ornithinibacillus halotolerans]
MIELLRKNIVIAVISLVAILILFFQLIDKDESSIAILTEEPISQDRNVEEKDIPDQIIVDIKGAIHQPGVYEMEPNSRVKDIVDKAGGFTKDANEYEINLAQKLFDEMIIIVPKMVEGDKQSNTASQSNKIRINYASVEEIETLPGIGPSKANAIIQYREEHGYFQKVEDLLQVSGIGEKVLEAIKEEIQVP